MTIKNLLVEKKHVLDKNIGRERRSNNQSKTDWWVKSNDPKTKLTREVLIRQTTGESEGS